MTSITIRPTPKMFMLGDVMVRAWEGATEIGVPVVALVSVVQVANGELAMPGLVSIPPPHPNQSVARQLAMGTLWHTLAALMDDEVTAISAVAAALATCESDPVVREVLADYLARMAATMREHAAETRAGSGS